MGNRRLIELLLYINITRTHLIFFLSSKEGLIFISLIAAGVHAIPAFLLKSNMTCVIT